MKRKTKIIVYTITSLFLVFILITAIAIFIKLKQIPTVTVRVVDQNNDPIEGAYVQKIFNIKQTDSWGVAKFWIDQNPQWVNVFIPKRGEFAVKKAIHHNNESFEYRVQLETSSPCNILKSTEELYKEVEISKDYNWHRNSFFSMSDISLIDKSILHKPELLYRSRKKAIEYYVENMTRTLSLDKSYLNKLEHDELTIDDLLEISESDSIHFYSEIINTKTPVESFCDLFNTDPKNPMERILEDNDLIYFRERGFLKNGILCYIEYPIIYNDNKCLFKVSGEYWTREFLVEIINPNEIVISCIGYEIA